MGTKITERKEVWSYIRQHMERLAEELKREKEKGDPVEKITIETYKPTK